MLKQLQSSPAVPSLASSNVPRSQGEDLAMGFESVRHSDGAGVRVHRAIASSVILAARSLGPYPALAKSPLRVKEHQ